MLFIPRGAGVTASFFFESLLVKLDNKPLCRLLQEGGSFVGQWSHVGRQTEQSFIGFFAVRLVFTA